METIKQQKSKLRTYGLFKTDPGMENYLTDIRNMNVRTQMTKLRLSNHILMIESGRHNKIPQDLRFCPFCPNMVETELHFLIVCPTYKTTRDKLFSFIVTKCPSFSYFTKEAKMIYLLGRSSVNYSADFFNKLFELRSQTLAQKLSV